MPLPQSQIRKFFGIYLQIANPHISDATVR
jgi:hypothetical protein